ncbi:methyltransferase domain-containing protein [Fluviispira multicolorata]|uniref:Methyltransferase domain-containing protein n=2 Tax=Fluviispira multicolorata TaxID=2654512 RepID=A0A833N584_9BACT|nr:methyltransferase domain-containing protein [Fluviispira multicolorata]
MNFQNINDIRALIFSGNFTTKINLEHIKDEKENIFYESNFCRLSLYSATHEIAHKQLTNSIETILIPINGVISLGILKENLNDLNQQELKDLILIGPSEPFTIIEPSKFIYLTKEKTPVDLIICELGELSSKISTTELIENESIHLKNKLLSLNDYYYGYERRYKKVYDEGAFLWESDSPNEILVQFLEHFPIEKLGKKLIDLGCGEGRDSLYLANKGFEVIGVDVSASALKRAREIAEEKNISLCFLERDVIYLRNLPFEGFDTAINMGCLHMISDLNHRLLHIKRVYEILKPGGYFLVAHCKSEWGKGFFSIPHWEKIGKLNPGEIINRRIKLMNNNEKFIPLEVVPYFESDENSLINEFVAVGFKVHEAYCKNTDAFGNTAVILFKKPI